MNVENLIKKSEEIDGSLDLYNNLKSDFEILNSSQLKFLKTDLEMYLIGLEFDKDEEESKGYSGYYQYHTERIIKIIAAELSRLEREKHESEEMEKKKGKGGKIAEKACTDEAKNNLSKFEKMLVKLNKILFENSTIGQWKSVLNNQTPSKQIIIKSDVTFKDLRYFFDKLKEIEVFEVDYLKPLVELQAFYTKKKMCTLKYKQLTEGLRSAKTAIPPLTDEINILFNK